MFIIKVKVFFHVYLRIHKYNTDIRLKRKQNLQNLCYFIDLL